MSLIIKIMIIAIMFLCAAFAILFIEYNGQKHRIKKLDDELMELRKDIKRLHRVKVNKTLPKHAGWDQRRPYEDAVYALDKKYYGGYRLVKLNDDLSYDRQKEGK